MHQQGSQSQSHFPGGQQPQRYVSQLYVIPAVDATEAGKGQLEISVNQGQVPNNVQMQDAGRCLVTFIPQHAGTYVIDVTFNGSQVHGCPIKVDVNTRHVGKPVSAPVYAHPASVSGYSAAVAGTSPPSASNHAHHPRPPSSLDRGPSSAYFSSGSPHIDTTFSSSYAPSPAASSAHRPPAGSPQSPPLVASVEHQLSGEQQPQHSPGGQQQQPEEYLRSPGLLKSSLQPQQPKGLLGYTVAQYGAHDKSLQAPKVPPPIISATSPPAHKYFGAADGQEKHASQQPQKYFERQKDETTRDWSPQATAETAQFQMTRSAELTLFRADERRDDAQQPKPRSQSPTRRHTPVTTIAATSDAALRDRDSRIATHREPFCPGGLVDYDAEARKRRSGASDEPYYDQIPAATASVETMQKHMELPYLPLDSEAKRSLTAWNASREFADERNGTNAAPTPTASATTMASHDRPEERVVETQARIQTHIVEPYSSDIEALTPGSRRRLLEHSVYKSEDLKMQAERAVDVETPAATTDHEGSEPPSRPSSKATTPRLSLKSFGRGDKMNTRERDGTFDFGKSKIVSKHEVVRRGKDVEVKIEALKLGKDDDLKVVVLPPSHLKNEQAPELPHKTKKSRNTYEVLFRPTEVGTHKVLAFVNNQYPHPHTPYPIRVYDATQITVGEIAHESVVNDTVEFTVDAGRAGFGNLEMAIKDSDGVIIPSHVSQLEAGSAKFLVTFNPTSLGTHTVNITFNKEPVKGSPFEVHVVDSPSAKETPTPETKKKHKKESKKEKSPSPVVSPLMVRQSNGNGTGAESAVGLVLPVVSKVPSLSRVGRPLELSVTVVRPDSDRVEASVVDPDKEPVPVEVVDGLEPGTQRIQFTPWRVGDHEVQVRVSGVEVEGSPFTCRVYDPEKILVSDIADGAVNKPVHFTVDASSAGVGNLEVAVNDGKIPSMAHALGHHRYDISFVPRDSVDHTISVRFNNEPVPGSPFLCRLSSAAAAAPAPVRVTASGPGLERVSVGQPITFWVDVHAPSGDQQPRVQITDPSGELLPVQVSSLDPDEPTRFTVTYEPKNVGNHQVSVKYDGQPIAGSPFTSKAFDASCVKLTLADDRAQVGKTCTFTIDAAKAGAGNMEIIVSVGKRNVPNYVQAEGQARFRVSFTPQEPQDHTISVKFNGIPIPGSPMHCPVSGDAKAALSPMVHEERQSRDTEGEIATVKSGELRLAGDLATAQVDTPKRFSIDTPAANLDCNVIVTGPAGDRVPVQRTKVDGGFDVSFVPQHPGEYSIDIRVNGRSLAICPIVCRCLPPPKVFESESGVQPSCGQPFEFIVDLPPVSSSSKRERNRTDARENLGIRVAITCVEGASSQPSLIPAHFEMDEREERVFVSFRALQRPAKYIAKVFRDERLLAERTFQSFSTAKKDGIEVGMAPVRLEQFAERVLVEHLVHFDLVATRTGLFQTDDDEVMEKRLNVSITDPDDVEVPVSLNRLGPELVRCEWQPLKEGVHRVDAQFDGRPILSESTAGPLLSTALDLSTVRVIGLRNDVVDVQQSFKLDWSNSGGTSAAVSVMHESGVEVKCAMKRVRKGLHVCMFTPPLPGMYLLTVLIDGMELPECPYECVASDEGAVRARGDALRVAQRGKTARFEVSPGTAGRHLGELDVLVTDPHKSPLPVRCYKQHDESYWVEFTPEHCGTHMVAVTFADVPVAGSPFRCEVVDPKKVAVRGLDRPLTLRHVANVVVNRKGAGIGPLSFEVQDPQGQQLKVDGVKTSNGEDSFTFLPVKLGVHKVSVKLAGFSVPGVPHSVMVEERRNPTLYGAALEHAVESGQQASMIFDSNQTPGGLKVDVRGPLNEKVRHSTNKRPDGTTEIAFRPTEVGVYEAHVEFNNKPITGSPFRVEVVEPSKVLLNDENFRADGLLPLTVNQRNVIDIDATAAGPARLRAEIRDADGELLDGESAAEVHNLGYGKYQLVLTPTRPGKYKIYLYCSELVVPSAYPILAIAEHQPSSKVAAILPAARKSPATEKRAVFNGESTVALAKVVLRGDGLANARVKEPAEFIVDCSELDPDAMGKCTATLAGDKVDIPVRLSLLRNQVYKGVYTPLVAGNYQLSVLVDGRHVHGSPTTVHVSGQQQSSAELIDVDTRPLKLGIIGEDVRTVIDARRAGPGHLSASCAGPTGLEYCELLDNRDGTYVLRITPRELGKHSLTIKYTNEQVPGSPFAFNVSNPPDASKVRVYGPGIEHGILHSFKSNFVVETKGAGAGQLTVRVRGPKGAFNVEMQRDRTQDRTIHCKYEPKEPGDYQVEVKWHGQHVPGSPFLVIIVDTEQELQRFLAGNAPSPPPASPFVPPGWIGPPLGHRVGPPPPPPPMLAAGPYGPPITSPVPYGHPPPHHPHLRGPRPPFQAPVPHTIYDGRARHGGHY